jgi:hypothetical protein
MPDDAILEKDERDNCRSNPAFVLIKTSDTASFGDCRAATKRQDNARAYGPSTFILIISSTKRIELTKILDGGHVTISWDKVPQRYSSRESVCKMSFGREMGSVAPRPKNLSNTSTADFKTILGPRDSAHE